MTSQPPSRPDPSSNGAAFHPDAASLIGAAVGRQLSGMLGELLPAALGQALAQAIATTPPKLPPCAACLVQRLNWEARHLPELQAAQAQAEFQTQVVMQAAAKMKADAGEPFDPAAVEPVSVLAFLPEPLHPHPEKPWDGDRMPQVLDATTIANGSLSCAFHIPGAPGPNGQLATQAKPIILAPGGISLSAVAAMASRPNPNMPGTPGQ